MFHTVLQKIKVALFIETRCICTLGDFTFRLRLLLSLNFGLSTYLSQKVKWFRWAKTWWLTRIV